MSRLRFTEGALKALKGPPGGRDTYFDGRGSGLGFRISGPNERHPDVDLKVFGVPYRHGKTQRWFTLKPDYPFLTLREAEKQAIQILARVALGEDPAADRARARATPPKQDHTMARVVAAFCDTLPNRRHRKTGRLLSSRHIANTERYLKQAADHWGNTDIFTIDDSAIIAFLEGIAATHQVAANRCHSSLSAMYRWASERNMAPKGVMVRLQRVGSEQKRKRVLKSTTEIPVVWAAAEALGYPCSQLTKLSLCLGQRISETAGMRWPNIEGDLWTITENKPDRATTVPLSSLAREILAECPQIADGFVFAGRNPRRPFTAFGSMKARLDAEIAKICAAQGKATLPEWHLHDLRRTCATELGGLGVGRFVIERVLNHSDDTVTSIYDLHRYNPEKRAALELWSARLRELCGLSPAPEPQPAAPPALRLVG
jgi:integrase